MSGHIPNFKCEVCGKPVYRNPNKPPKHITCSKECRSILSAKLNRVLVKCEYCGKELYRTKSRSRGRIYCNNECYLKANPPVDEELVIELHKNGLYDKEIAEKLQCARSNVTRILNKFGYKNRRTKINDLELRARLSASNKGKRTGSENHNYKGNSEFVNLARGLFNAISKAYKVKKNFTCERCGKRGGNLNTHHKKRFHQILKEFIDIYGDILTTENFSKLLLTYEDFVNESNLELLCVKCHKEEHKKEKYS